MKLFLVLIFFICTQAQDFSNFESAIENELPYFYGKDITPTWNSNQKEIMKLEKHNLQSHLDRDFGTNKMKGKITIINFFFATCPGYCPRITKNVKSVYSQYKGQKDIQFVSYSVTPNIDTLKVLQEYAKDNAIEESNWHLARGKRDTIYKVAREQLYADMAIDLNKDKDQFVHTESIYLVDQELRIRGIYNSASKRALNELSEDIKKLQN